MRRVTTSMSDEKPPESKIQRRKRLMRAACSHLIEAADADAVCVVLSFNDADRSSVRMASAGNRVLCATMLEIASEKMQELMEDGDE